MCGLIKIHQMMNLGKKKPIFVFLFLGHVALSIYNIKSYERHSIQVE